MLLTPQGGPRCLAPTAHQIPVYLMVFSTFLCRAFTAQYLYTPRYCYISPLCFTAQRRLEVHDHSYRKSPIPYTSRIDCPPFTVAQDCNTEPIIGSPAWRGHREAGHNTLFFPVTRRVDQREAYPRAWG